jgi:hypothetical protein
VYGTHLPQQRCPQTFGHPHQMNVRCSGCPQQGAQLREKGESHRHLLRHSAIEFLDNATILGTPCP